MTIIDFVAIVLLAVLVGAGVGVFGGLVLYLIERRNWK